MEKIYNMSNNELGIVAKAFTECGKYENCSNCPCDGVLCSRDDFQYARDIFMAEVAKRLMERK